MYPVNNQIIFLIIIWFKWFDYDKLKWYFNNLDIKRTLEIKLDNNYPPMDMNEC